MRYCIVLCVGGGWGVGDGEVLRQGEGGIDKVTERGGVLQCACMAV